MPCSKFVVSHAVGESFRISKVMGMFDCNMTEVKKEYDVNIPTEDMKWNVGLIVGASGSGKTTIAKKVFSDFEFFSGFKWNKPSLLDDFSSELSAKQITESLSKVGFSSPPDWLKPFSVLSNGQKMRAELARLILESDKPFIYDEFTSVVDRQVACIGSSAIQKFVRKSDKQFIAVSCHYDVAEWLQPDWIYDVNKMEFSRGSLRQPEIKVTVRKAEQREWSQFMGFHYLSHNHNKSAHKYIAEIKGEPVAWCSVLPFPHPKLKKVKRIHRLVVRPDYQGIGLGSNLINEVAKEYKKQGFGMLLTTSSPALIHGLIAKGEWVMTRKPSRISGSKHSGSIRIAPSKDRLTATFRFKD